MNRFSKKPISIVLGAAFALTGMAAQASVFQATDLGTGYMVAAAGEGKCGEGKCGEGKSKSATMTMTPAQMFEKMDTNSDKTLTVAEFEKNHKAVMEGKCGEGKCGEKKK